MRKLSLRKDTLTELTPGQLGRVAGAASLTEVIAVGGKTPTMDCLPVINRQELWSVDECTLTGGYPTIPVTACVS